MVPPYFDNRSLGPLGEATLSWHLCLLPWSELGVEQLPSSWLDPRVWLGQMEPEESGEVCLGYPKGEKQRQD